MNLKFTLLAVSLVLMSLQTVQAAPVVYFDFDGDGLKDSSFSAALGDTLTASLYVTNVDSLQGGLFGWGTEINFLNSELSANSYSIDSQWYLPGVDNFIDNNNSLVSLYSTRLSGLTGTIKLAEISFTTLSAGSSLLSMSELSAGKLNFVGFGGAASYNYDPQIMFGEATATINVSAVPVPPAILLFVSGLIGLMGFKKQRTYC